MAGLGFLDGAGRGIPFDEIEHFGRKREVVMQQNDGCKISHIKSRVLDDNKFIIHRMSTVSQCIINRLIPCPEGFLRK